MTTSPISFPIRNSNPFDPEWFFKTLLIELSGLLQDIHGKDEAFNLIHTSVKNMAPSTHRTMKKQLQSKTFTDQDIKIGIVTLMNQLHGSFSISEDRDDHSVIQNTACPFGSRVVGKTSICAVTDAICEILNETAGNQTRINLTDTIASGSPCCLITLHYPT